VDASSKGVLESVEMRDDDYAGGEVPADSVDGFNKLLAPVGIQRTKALIHDQRLQLRPGLPGQEL